MSAPAKIIALVDHFRQNADAYRSDDYKEAEVRQEFIDPFFECLGWDMDNEQGHAEAFGRGRRPSECPVRAKQLSPGQRPGESRQQGFDAL